MTVLKARAFLFDMDGTLVDSSVKVEQIWSHWCQLHGIELKAVMAIQQGVRSFDTISRVAPHLDIEKEAAWVDQHESDDCEGIIEIAGAARILAQLPAECWTVVTSASLQLASSRMNYCQLTVPPQIVCAEDVSAGKPDPEPYRLAASRMNCLPADCMAFEDAPAGVASAVAAGCQVVQIGGQQKLHPAVLAVLPDWQGVNFVPADGEFILAGVTL